MKKLFLFLFSSLLMIGLYSCKDQNPATNPDDNTPQEELPDYTGGSLVEATFPMKHVIEEFTGQDCGYCPYGMDCVSAFMADDDNWILLMHHYGYNPDHFSVTGSDKICTKLGVSGAPSVSIDRNSKVKSLNFHPGYLPDIKKSRMATETYVSTVIANTYDAGTGELKVNVSGQMGKADAPELMLTVMVKESGMVDYQADYYDTFEGWLEFRHVSAVRAFLTAPMGDKIQLKQDAEGRVLYNAEYTIKLDSKWVANNCAVVAIVSEGELPIVQVEEQPVVAGTKGGRDIEHGGITTVPVSELYPEPENGYGPFDYYTAGPTIPFTSAAAQYVPYSQYGFNYWQIMAENQSETFNCEGTNCMPFLYLYLFTELNQTTIPYGTYQFSTTLEPGTAYAGFRDDEEQQLGGSELYFISYTYRQQGYMVPSAEWLIVSGTLTIEEGRWSINGTTRGGKTVRCTMNGEIQNGGRANSPALMLKKRPMDSMRGIKIPFAVK